MSRSKQKEFDDWLETAQQPQRSSASWRLWPQEMCTELEKAVAHNDQHPMTPVPLAALIGRWENKYKIRANYRTITTYCRSVLNRQSFLKAR